MVYYLEHDARDEVWRAYVITAQHEKQLEAFQEQGASVAGWREEDVRYRALITQITDYRSELNSEIWELVAPRERRTLPKIPREIPTGHLPSARKTL